MMTTYKTHDRVVVTAGVHKDKHGSIVFVSGQTASVKFDDKYHGGTYYVGLDILQPEK